MIIYEVNITIDEIVYNEYIDWLNIHIKKMLKYDGFIKVERYKHLNQPLTKNIILHYYISSYKKLDNYLKFNSKKMRKDGTDLFKNNTIIKRRILKHIK